uniref:Uncharacterized protein n=1 Tax=Anopheles melas TaxID=34690 RepID=A0A182TV86_9DIPT
MSTEEISSSGTDDGPQSLARRIIHYFYHRQAIAKDAWDIAFWQEFRRHHPDVTLEPKALRSYFLYEVMRNPREWSNLSYEVIQYLNPLFNRIREEVLEYRDLVEGIDYVYAEDPADLRTEANGTQMPPLCLEPGGGLVAPSRATKRYITPSTAQIRSFVAAALSELLWTEDENETKPTLDAQECLSRIAVLTSNSIALLNCIEPGMACYERFHGADPVERAVLPEDDTPASGLEVSGTPRMHPLASSTPIPSTSGQPGTVRGPIISSRTPASVLRHVRSKPRKGAFKRNIM